ncbi:nitrilase [Candidatus Aminicenantes bacterium AC-708-M15]|jgi:predicted amidohydrolase|nr:nitrilase [SCandidatus Aminicenantes bacterium Aminicenantia_JdfR_composite]MCP2596808.1 nitrilase [Candidatus Aminicenantes bacterium AC-335-G13]MCP2598269.1 nitrilase [Candidatus Aminicenantes bacterium AC-335-L06]MCP2604008.1 nitrilase [Candidatus Aminicenantes bacterium AC-708-M15]MCP2618499.1 nitrilase [Candidatus Aminicenantes bacterium AC-335-A11]MCP2620941.1 nitrilase [Candidatus Aminicenantes bacterium AC-334-E05]
MKVTVAQIAPRLGDIEKNFQTHLDILENAKKQKSDLVIFPELSLTGYSLQDLVSEVALQVDSNHYFSEFKKISRDISFIIGFVEEKERGIFYNSSAFFNKGEIIHIHRKIFLPNYGIFEEARFFAKGNKFSVISSELGKIGILICRDFLHFPTSYILFVQGVEIIVVVSNSPVRGVSDKEYFESARLWECHGENVARLLTSFVIYCNRVGFEEGLCFGGGSFIFNPFGKIIKKADYIEEEIFSQEIDLQELKHARCMATYKRDDNPELILRELKKALNLIEKE